LARRQPTLAWLMLVGLVSLAGVPPLAGFLGKWYLFAAAARTLDPWCIAVVVAGLLNSVLSVYYYMRIVKVMYLDKDESIPLLPADRALVRLAVILAVPVVFLIFRAGPVYEWTGTLMQVLTG
jgi:NADH-quinone oxidoreductase subunit N